MHSLARGWLRTEWSVPNLRLGGTWLFPFYCGSVTNQFTYWGFIAAIFLNSGMLFRVYLCSNVKEMIIRIFNFTDGMMLMKLLITLSILNDCALYWGKWPLKWCISFYKSHQHLHAFLWIMSLRCVCKRDECIFPYCCSDDALGLLTKTMLKISWWKVGLMFGMCS